MPNLLDRRSLPSIIAPLAAALLATSLLGQTPDTAPPAPTPPPARPSPRPAPPDTAPSSNPGPIITVEFPGGTARQFVDAIRAASGGGNVNVIMPKEAEIVALPQISLRDVNVFTALQALEFAVNADSTGQFAVARLDKGAESSATFAVRYSGPRNPYTGGPPSMPRETRVFSLRELVENTDDGAPGAPEPAILSTDTILSAVKAASQLDTDAKSPVPELMLHKESLLLIVRATPDQQRTIDTVIRQLAQTASAKRARILDDLRHTKAAAREQSEVQVLLDINTAQMAEAKANLEKATAELDRTTKLFHAGQASDAEVRNARAAAATAQSGIDQLTASRRGIEERKALLEVRRAGGTDAPSGEDAVPVVYNYQDLEAFGSDVVGICYAVATLGRSGQDVRFEQPDKNVVIAYTTPSQHKVIIRALNAIRRAKANEPKLPGLSSDDLIRKGLDAQAK